jgi:hypothetical protein
MLPPNVSTSSSGTNDATSSAARHKSALTGILLLDDFYLEPRSMIFIPPGLPVINETGSSGSSTGLVFNPEQDDSIKIAPKANDNIWLKRVYLGIWLIIAVYNSCYFNTCATMRIGSEFVKKKGRGCPLP